MTHVFLSWNYVLIFKNVRWLLTWRLPWRKMWWPTTVASSWWAVSPPCSRRRRRRQAWTCLRTWCSQERWPSDGRLLQPALRLQLSGGVTRLTISNLFYWWTSTWYWGLPSSQGNAGSAPKGRARLTPTPAPSWTPPPCPGVPTLVLLSTPPPWLPSGAAQTSCYSKCSGGWRNVFLRLWHIVLINDLTVLSINHTFLTALWFIQSKRY